MRALHEEIERNQTAVVALLKEPPRTHRATLRQSHAIAAILARIGACGAELSQLYEDRDGARRAELAATTGAGPAAFQHFYARLRDVRDRHRAAPDAPAEPPPAADADAAVLPLPRFSGAESFGRHLDLAPLFEQWRNVDPPSQQQQQPMTTDYLSWLGALVATGGSGGCLDPAAAMPVPPASRAEEERDARMAAFLGAMREYLVGFYRRTQPLVDVDAKVADLCAEFERLWAVGTFGIEDRSGGGNGSGSADGPVHCSLCRRDFAKRTVFEHHVLSRAHKQRAERLAAEVAGAWGQQRHAALRDAFVARGLCESLREVVRDTKDFVSRKQARLPREIDEEAFAGGDEDASDTEDAELIDAATGVEEDLADEVKQTIDNYPTGWDGRPIPYWLYRLHGLGVEYRCAICGGTSYWGRRAFERHFQEWRHTHGLALLGIPNTVQFFDITEINDAIELWRKIQADRAAVEWKPDAEEECEDTDGNVYSRKLFDALVRQGIITPKKK